MPSINCFPNVGELIFKFNSEDHLERHLHAKHRGGDFEIRVYFETFDGKDFWYDYKFPSTFSKGNNPILGKYKKLIVNQLNGTKDMIEKLIKEFDEKVILED